MASEGMQTTVGKDMGDIPKMRHQAEKLKKETRIHGALQCGKI